MSPQAPRRARQLRMARLRGEVIERAKEGGARTLARLHPQVAAFAAVRGFVVTRTERRGIPLRGERLPVQIVRGRLARGVCVEATPVLMHDYRAHLLHPGGDPRFELNLELERVGLRGIRH